MLNHKKAPTARVGFAVGAFYPLTHPWGKLGNLENLADTCWLKGLVYMQSLILEV